MIADEQNLALLTVGNAALINDDWKDYASYCFDREKGLRKEAFKHLDAFLKSTEIWTFDQKIDFIKFLFPFFENVHDADYGPFPQPLSDKLVKPVLTAWCELEQSDSNPFRWYGKYFRSIEHLFKALELDPADDLARETIISWWINNLSYSTHHLPEGYIGDPFEDLKLGDKIKEQILQLKSGELSAYWTKLLDQDLELIRNYTDWKTSGHSDFEKWGQENKKQTGYGIDRTYYYEK